MNIIKSLRKQTFPGAQRSEKKAYPGFVEMLVEHDITDYLQFLARRTS